MMMGSKLATNGRAAGGALVELLAGLAGREGVKQLGDRLESLKKPAPATPAPLPVPPVPNGKPTVEPGRDKGNGRFTEGNQFARGRANPHARKQAAFRAVLSEAVDEDRVRRIAVRLAEQAEGGDLEATKLLFAYLLGKPTAASNPDALDVEEWRLLDAQPTAAELWRALLDNVDDGDAAEHLRKRLSLFQLAERLRDNKDMVETLAAKDKRCGRKRRPSVALPT
ncbi:MAG: hypothetical protein ACYC3I_09015 [Gemmataceae bacterium]